MKNNNKGVTFEERQQRRAAAQARETLLMLKFVCAVIAVIVGIAGVLAIRNNGMNTMGFYLYAKLPLTIVFAVLTVAAAVYFIIKKRVGANESGRVVTSTGMLAASLTALVMTVSYDIVGIEYDTTRILVLIAIAVLYFVYHIYNSVFFTVSAQCALAVFTVNLLSKTSVSAALRAVIAVGTIAVCTVAAFILLRAFSKKNGANVKDYKFYIMAAIITAGALLSLFIPAITVYAVFAILAVYLVIAVISTIEMM